MDATLKKVVRMLSHERVEKQYAAAMVLAELRVKDAAVVDPLGRCLSTDNRLLKVSALEALAGVRSNTVADHVVPLLDDPDEEIRARAAAIMGNQGKAGWTALTRELHVAPLTRKRMIIAILVRNHTAVNMDNMVGLLRESDVADHVLAALCSEIDHMTPSETRTLIKKAQDRLEDDEWQMDPQRMARTVRLLGYVRSSKLVPQILPFADEKYPVPVRLAALAGLRRPLGGSRNVGETYKVLLRHAEDTNPTLARAALDTLQNLTVPSDATPELLNLADGRHAEARSFALAALGRMGDTKVIRNLIAQLDKDRGTREAAVETLSQMEGASALLFKELQAADKYDVVRVELIGRILEAHKGNLSAETRRGITVLALRAMEERWDTAEVLLELLAEVEPGGFSGALTSRAMSFKRAGRFDEAFSLLRKVDSAGLLDELGRYTALVAGLCTRPTKRDLGRADRRTDPVLRHVTALVESGYSVASRMTEEEALTEEDLFFVGFNFAGSKDDDERDFGGEVLAHLAETKPDSKLGQNAKNRLKLVGLEDYLASA